MSLHFFFTPEHRLKDSKKKNKKTVLETFSKWIFATPHLWDKYYNVVVLDQCQCVYQFVSFCKQTVAWI